MKLRRIVAMGLILAVLSIFAVPALAAPKTAALNPNLKTLQMLSQSEPELEAQTPAANGKAITSQAVSTSDPKFTRMLKRLLFLEAIRLLLMQLSGVNLSFLGGDFWAQLYIRVVAQGMGAEYSYDATAGVFTLVKGTAKVEVRLGAGVISVISGSLQVDIPGDLRGTGAATSFWKIADLLRSMLTLPAFPVLP